MNTLRIPPKLKNNIDSSVYDSVLEKFSYIGHMLTKSSRFDSTIRLLRQQSIIKAKTGENRRKAAKTGTTRLWTTSASIYLVYYQK